MYPYVLFLHSWLRWGVLLLASVVAVRAGVMALRGGPFTPIDDRLRRGLRGVVDLQFTIGLVLYVALSPMVRAAFGDFGAAMKSAPLRFFAVEHITVMVIAVGVVHAFVARSRRAVTEGGRHRSMLWASGGLLVLALVGIPWPELAHGRPLFRSPAQLVAAPTPEAERAPSVFMARCAACHGKEGHGDGVAAAAMKPKPRDFRDPGFQRKVTDRELKAVIVGGGLARGLSAAMPPHADLSEEDVEDLVRYIRAAKF